MPSSILADPVYTLSQPHLLHEILHEFQIQGRHPFQDMVFGQIGEWNWEKCA